MEKAPDTTVITCNSDCNSSAEHLNRDCLCLTLNRDQLLKILHEDTLNRDILAHHPQLFSNTTVFISSAQLQQMRDIIQAVTHLVKLPAYQQQVLARSPSISAHNPGTAGVFMGYDFHLTEQGAKLIEINTNAGGGFLNAALASAQTQCCRAMGSPLPQLKAHIDDEFMSMFLREWKLQRGEQRLTSIAIVDENPQQQFLYPEFKMAQRLLERNGIRAIIVDPSELELADNKILHQGNIIDLIYNRLTDFSFSAPRHALLARAYENNAVVITPNPRQHAFYADKRNLVLMSDPVILKNLGAEQSDIAILHKGIPRTQNVTAENAGELWGSRRQLFFKPALGFGSRATYSGEKLTKRVWDEILQGDYIAQQLVLPGRRGILIDGCETALKMDIRAYVYAGEIQLLAARLYRGQTTNFRTDGGGFAPVVVAE